LVALIAAERLQETGEEARAGETRPMPAGTSIMRTPENNGRFSQALLGHSALLEKPLS
jgi:hypothetical protein